MTTNLLKRSNHMQINKKLLLAIITLFAHNILINMETDIIQTWQTVSEPDAAPGWRTASEYKKEATQHAKRIVIFTKDSSTNMSHNHKEIKELVIWLTEQRNNFSDEEWKKLIHKLNKRILTETAKCPYSETKKRKAMIEIIQEIVLSLEPGKNCSKTLTAYIEKELKKIEENAKKEQSSSQEASLEEQ